jgi:hypothetical protein
MLDYSPVQQDSPYRNSQHVRIIDLCDKCSGKIDPFEYDGGRWRPVILQLECGKLLVFSSRKEAEKYLRN